MLRAHPQKGSLPVFRSLVDSLDLPSLPAIINGEWSKSAWKRWVKNLTLTAEYSSFLDVCDHLPLSDCLLRLGKPIPHWSVTRGLPKLTRLNNFRIRLLVGCDGLEADASWFRRRKYAAAALNDPTCRLCKLEPAVPAHFILRCSALVSTRDSLLRNPDICIDLYNLSHTRFLRIILGVDDSSLQLFIIEFLNNLLQARNSLLLC